METPTQKTESQRIEEEKKQGFPIGLLIFTFIVICLGVFFYSNKANDERPTERELFLEQELAEQYQITNTMSMSINDLRRELSEAWGGTLICADGRDLYPCGSTVNGQ